jgi:hypothetical protein
MGLQCYLNGLFIEFLMSVGDYESMSLKAYKVVPQFGIATLVNVYRMRDTCMFIYIYTRTYVYS